MGKDTRPKGKAESGERRAESAEIVDGLSSVTGRMIGHIAGSDKQKRNCSALPPLCLQRM